MSRGTPDKQDEAPLDLAKHRAALEQQAEREGIDLRTLCERLQQQIPDPFASVWANVDARWKEVDAQLGRDASSLLDLGDTTPGLVH